MIGRSFGLRAMVMVFLALTIAADVFAQTATYLGRDADLGPGWRSSSVAKDPLFDADGDGAYGSVGYYLPISTGGTGPNTIVSQLPSYISTVIPAATYGETAGFLQMADDPTQPISANVSDITLGYIFTASGAETDFLNITLAEPVTFVLGIFFDHHTNINYDGSATSYTPSDIRVRQTVGGSANSGLVNMSDVRNGVIDFMFFTVSGNAGDQFTISGTQNGGWSNQGIGGITFETVPEPASPALLGIGALAMFWIMRRRRRTS